MTGTPRRRAGAHRRVAGLHRAATRTARRIAMVLSALIATAGALWIAAPASAHAATITAAPVCDTTAGEYHVTWTVSNDWSTRATLSSVTATPTAVAGIAVNTTVPARANGRNGTVRGLQRVPGTRTSASLQITSRWSDGYVHRASKTITLGGTCKPPAPVCVSAADADYGHQFSGPAGTATVGTSGLPLCAGARQDFTLVSYTATGAGAAGAQQQYDIASGTVDSTRPKVNLSVEVPDCAHTVYLLWGSDTDAALDDAARYAATRLGGAQDPGRRSAGPLGQYAGGTRGCTSPTATVTDACDGTATAHLSNGAAATLPVRFTVTAAGGFTRAVTVAPGASADVALAADAGTVTVRADGDALATHTWQRPAGCAPPTVTATPDCTSLAVAVTNPVGNAPVTATVSLGDGTARTVTVAAGATETLSLPVEPDAVVAVTAGPTRATFDYVQPEDCKPLPEPSVTATPTTAAPTTAAPTTAAPTTAAPTTAAPTTAAPVTATPTVAPTVSTPEVVVPPTTAAPAADPADSPSPTAATPTGWAGPGGTVAPVTPPAREPAAGRAGSPTGGPSLPVTGLALSWILAAGVGLLVVGVLLTRTTRRGAHRAR